MVSRSSNDNFYQQLGIDRHATSADIRTAYKRLALLWHPDRNKGKDAEEKFKKIKQAYDVLSDEHRRRVYDQQQSISTEQKRHTWYEATNMKYAQTNEDVFNLHTSDHFMSARIDPFDILNDIQCFQESNFTSKMMNSPSYRHLYTHLFNKMNNDSNNYRHIHTSSPVFLNNDRLFRPTSKARSKHHHSSSKRSSINHIPVIQSTMENDRFLNELIDLYERQNPPHVPAFNSDPLANDSTDGKDFEKKTFEDQTRLIPPEQQRRPTHHRRHRIIPSQAVRV